MTSSNPNYLLKFPPPNAVTMGVRASTYELGGKNKSSPNTSNSSQSWISDKTYWPLIVLYDTMLLSNCTRTAREPSSIVDFYSSLSPLSFQALLLAHSALAS
jgi:hypothetical protein